MTGLLIVGLLLSLPFIIAAKRDRRNTLAILALNLTSMLWLLGCTVGPLVGIGLPSAGIDWAIAGWIGALVWSLTKDG
jgi:hypothetical protein